MMCQCKGGGYIIKTTFWSVLGLFLLYCCTPTPVIDQARLLGDKAFSKDAWANANQEQRGEMVASLLSQHEPASLSADVVKQLLGPPTSYYHKDEELAYLVGPRSKRTHHADGYLLIFFSDKATGRITSVKIFPEPKP